MSATQSLVALLAEEMIREGKLDRDALVPTYLPELAETAWQDATIAHVMDMLVSMIFDENYLNPDFEVCRYLRSAGMLPPRPGTDDSTSFYDYLPEVAPDGTQGRIFAYREPNINVLGWLVRRASGQDLASLLSERVWQSIGAERNAYFMLDSSGAETTTAMKTRDFARFGELIRNRGRVGGRQVVVDPSAEIVIARTGSSKQSPSTLLDPVVFPTFDALIERVSRS